jgi:protease I
MSLESRTVAVLVADLYEDLELWYPYLRLQEAGARVVAVGAEARTYRGKHGTEKPADAAVAEVEASEFDAVVIPGGYSPDHMRRHPPMVDLVRAVHDRGGVVAAICHGGWMLASAGLLEGRTVTGFFSIKDDMVNAGAEWVDREVVEDGRVITSRRPDDLPAFCRTIIAALEG